MTSKKLSWMINNVPRYGNYFDKKLFKECLNYFNTSKLYPKELDLLFNVIVYKFNKNVDN